MSALTFREDRGQILATVGPRTFTVTQDQADRWCALFFEHDLKPQLNSLWEAMQAAGYVPWCDRVAA